MMVEKNLDQAVSELRRDPSKPVRARVDGLDVELRVVGSTRDTRPLGQFIASLGPWEGESVEELQARLREAREVGGSASRPEL